MNELRELLMNVPDSYYDFVEGLLDEAKKSKQRELGLIRFLKTHPQANSSDVLKFLVDDLSLYEESRHQKLAMS